MIGKTLAHYEITAKLGEGGMGEVYRARDTELGREVAIKLLREDIAADAQRMARLRREARSLASLNHPSVAMVYELGQADGRRFIVMELVEGLDLAQRLSQGPMPATEAIPIATQIAEGLAAAHARGIVHRDLKPANVKITPDGRVKLLDFGLAKQTPMAGDAEETTAEDLTTDGSLLGTPNYMPPERIKGTSDDERGDLFALGIILYEMLKGEHPFRQPSVAETMSAILRDEPPTLASQPTPIAQLVRSCLMKDPAQRIASASEVARVLISREPAADDGIDSLAVLPFHNEADDEDVDYLIDGICDSLIDNLSQLPRLKVMARSTVFRCRELHDRPDEVGRELGVRAVLTGRLQKRRETLVLRSELVNAADGTRLWGGRFDRPMTDVLAIEGEICREITDKLRFRLTNEEKGRIAKRHERDPRAHDAYMQGRFFWNRWKTADAMTTAIGSFEQALDCDPLYALAYGGLADSYSILGNIKALPPDEAYPRAKDAARKGLAIDDTLAELHTSLAFIQRFWDWDWVASERGFQRAIELNPGYATAHRFYGHLLTGLGRHDEAIPRVERALELDPLSLILHTAVGDAYFYARRYDEAMVLYRKAMQLDEAFIPAHTDLARSLELAGRYDEAIESFKRAEALMPEGPPEPSSGLAHVYARMGRRDEALTIVDQLLQKAKTRYVSPYGIASIYACLGDIETSLDWLEKAHAGHDQTLVWVKVHPRLDPVREHPRFQSLLEKMQLI